MPIPGPVSPVLDAVISTQSPYWLCLHGVWVQLEGVTPGSQRNTVRATSEFISTDGYRFVQQAPRAARDWSLDWQYAVPASVAALSVAAEAPGDVWLLDLASAVSNMLSPRDCYGHDAAAPVLDCAGVPLRAIASAEVVTSRVRAGVPYTLGIWTGRATSVAVCALVFPGGAGSVVSAGVGERATTTFVPTVDGDLTITMSGSGWAGAGLQLVEGDLPSVWLAGERTPCKVSVGDVSRVLNLLRSGSTGRSDYSVALQEVG